MILSKILKNTFLVLIFGLVVTACATKKTTESTKIDSQIQADVYMVEFITVTVTLGDFIELIAGFCLAALF